MNNAKNYITLLQKYEQSPQEVIEIRDGHEPEEFLKIWFDDEKIKSFNKNRFSEITIECNNFYKDVRQIKIKIMFHFQFYIFIQF